MRKGFADASPHRRFDLTGAKHPERLLPTILIILYPTFCGKVKKKLSLSDCLSVRFGISSLHVSLLGQKLINFVFLQHGSFAEGESGWNASEIVLDLVDL